MWAIESAGGLGYLLAQQNKNDPNDALSVAVAALRAPRLASVARADHAGVLRLLAKRNNDLGRARNKTACRLHALLAELVPGGIPNEINAGSAERMLASAKPHSPVEVARHALALEHLDDLRRLDAQMRTSKKRIGEASRRIGHLAHRTVRGRTGRRRDAHRLHRRRRPLPQPRSFRRLHRHRSHRSVFWRADHTPPLTTRQPTAQPRAPHRRDHPDPVRALPGRAFFERKVAEGKTKKEAVRALKRRIADAVYPPRSLDHVDVIEHPRNKALTTKRNSFGAGQLSAASGVLARRSVFQV